MQSRDGPGPERDRLRAGGQQHPDGFPVSAAARLAEAHTGQRLPGRSHSVDIVALVVVNVIERELPTLRFGRQGVSAASGPEGVQLGWSDNEEVTLVWPP
jgi:hypothetical protein